MFSLFDHILDQEVVAAYILISMWYFSYMWPRCYLIVQDYGTSILNVLQGYFIKFQFSVQFNMIFLQHHGQQVLLSG